ncbi:MAG: hypothetical protein ACE5E5_02410 [Phycisphaerae bacterium]
MTVLSSGGVLLQAGGCAFDPLGSVSQLVTLAGTNLIADWVFGAFNLTT